MMWTTEQTQQIAAECAALHSAIDRGNCQDTLTLAATVARARSAAAEVEEVLGSATAFIEGLTALSTTLSRFAVPSEAQVRATLDAQVAYGKQVVVAVTGGVRANVGGLAERARTLLDTLSPEVLEECLEELGDAVASAVNEVDDEGGSLVDDLLDELESLGDTLTDEVEEALDRIEEIRDTVESLLESAAEISQAVNDGTAEASDSLQVAADIVNTTRDCISQL